MCRHRWSTFLTRLDRQPGSKIDIFYFASIFLLFYFPKNPSRCFPYGLILNPHSTLATGYVLAHNIQTSLINQTATKNTLSLFFSAKGIWAYQFTDAQKLQQAKAIAGKTVAAAQNILKNTPGIDNATINVNGGSTLPTDYNQISIVIQPSRSGWRYSTA
jgi:hypothetical protein